MLVKDWRWRSHLGIGLPYILKSPFSAPKHPCALFILKNGSLGELGHQWFLHFRLGLLHLHDCKGACLWRLCAWTLRGNVLRSVIGKTKSNGGVRSNIYRLHLDLVVKQLCCNSLYLLSIFDGACLLRILFMESKKFWKDVLVSLFWSFKMRGQSVAK